jgi:thymidine phosphorylase
MNESLAKNVGNSLEVRESIEFLLNKPTDKKLKDITFALATQMLILTQVVKTKEEALIKLEDAISSGKAGEVFNKMVFMQSGIKDFLSKYETLLPTSSYKKDVFLTKQGYVSHINTRELGLCLVELGGGRKIANDTLDLSCGLENVLKIGDKIDKTTPFLTLHYNKKDDFDKISKILNSIIKIDENKDNCMKIKNVYEEII